MNIDRLRGEIVAVFKTQSAFASAMKWHQNKVSRMMTGKYLPTVDDAANITCLLSLTREKYEEIFLPKASPNGDKHII